MNRRYGLSAAKTLKIAQKLYENKLITYPRSDSRYLSSDIKSAVPKTLNALSQIKPGEIAGLNLKILPFTNRIIADNKVTDGKMVDIEELKEALKEKGIGTPATRASIIELLISRNYIERKKKTLLAADAGRYLVSIIRNTVLTSPELTGEWEHQLKQIEKGKRSSEGFMEGIISFTHEILRSSGSIQVHRSQIGHCPKCQRRIIQGKNGYGCLGWKDGCDYVLWMDYKGHRLTPAEAQELLQTGRLENPITIAQGNRIDKF